MIDFFFLAGDGQNVYKKGRCQRINFIHLKPPGSLVCQIMINITITARSVSENHIFSKLKN